MTKAREASTPHEITVAIATLGARAQSVQLPPKVDGLIYEVFVQAPPTPMPSSDRADVSFAALPTLGLSLNRNAALASCKTPFLVFADDDMVLDPAGLRALASEFAKSPQLGFAVGWRAGRLPQSGARSGRYSLRKTNSGRICAPELMVRIEAVRDMNVQFDPEFGVGAAHPVGEDYIFVCDLLDAGLRGKAFPIVVGSHDGFSTGDDWKNAGLLAARRAVVSRCFGAAAPIILLAYALRHRKRLGGWAAAWQFWTGRKKSE